jgi:hypothetical protein
VSEPFYKRVLTNYQRIRPVEISSNYDIMLPAWRKIMGKAVENVLTKRISDRADKNEGTQNDHKK